MYFRINFLQTLNALVKLGLLEKYEKPLVLLCASSFSVRALLSNALAVSHGALQPSGMLA